MSHSLDPCLGLESFIVLIACGLAHHYTVVSHVRESSFENSQVLYRGSFHRLYRTVRVGGPQLYRVPHLRHDRRRFSVAMLVNLEVRAI